MIIKFSPYQGLDVACESHFYEKKAGDFWSANSQTFKYFAPVATFDIVSDSWHGILTKVKKAVKKIATFLPVK